MSLPACILKPHRVDGKIVTWYWTKPSEDVAGCVIPTETTEEKKRKSYPKPSEGGVSDPSAGGTKEEKCFPAVPAIPGTPAMPPTESEMIVAANKGWNAHARSSNALPDYAYIEFHIDPASEGVFVGLGPVGMDGEPLTAFDHGMMFTVHGARVFESGVLGAYIVTSFTGDTVMKIARDGTDVTYSAGISTNTSAVTITDTDELFVYVYMYSGGDGIMCAAFKTLDDVASDGDTASNAGDGAMVCNIPAIDAKLVYTEGLSMLEIHMPALTSVLDELVYRPPTPVTMFASLPPIACTGFMLTSRPGSIATTMPGLKMSGGDTRYGFVDASLGPLWSVLHAGTRLDMDMFSYMTMAQMEDFEALQIMVVMEGLQIASIQAVTRIMVQQMIEDMQVSGTMSMLGEYALSMNDILGLRQYFTQTVGNQPSFDANSRVWVLNTDTTATVQFDNYAFNSYFHHGGSYYGVADNGIYLLDGDDDAGDAIQAEIQLGSTQFGAGEHKRLPSVYVNASSDGRLIVKISVDGEDPWYYEARSSSDKLSKHRVDPGRGLIGTNWTFTLLNQDGDDFELADLTFIPLTGSRRI